MKTSNPEIDYRSKYPISKMSLGSKKGMFGDGVGKHLTPLVSRAPKVVLPGISTFDPLFLDFLRSLSNKINEDVPVDLGEDLFTRSGNFSSADSLRTVAGYMMNPMSYIPRNNQEYRASLGLKIGMDADERTIALNVWKLLFSAYMPAPIKVNRRSNSGPPRNTHDAVWKKEYAEWILKPDNLDKMLTALVKGDFLTIRNEYEIMPMMTVQKRDQVDTPGKVREVYDRDYAVSGGTKGGLHAADKRVVIDGREYEDFSATRARVINAGAWTSNCVLSMVSTGTMKGMFERYPSVFHVNTDEEIKKLVDGCHVFCGDVKEYDRSMDKEDMEIPHLAMREYWDERLAILSEVVYHSAYYSRPLELEGTRGVLVGNYEKYLEPQVVCGNRSGHALTSLIAKGNKVVDTLILFHKCGLRVIGNEETFLLGNGPINLINNGDDEIVYSKDKNLLERFKELRKDPLAGRYLITPEEGQAFSGRVLRVDNFGDVVYHPSPRPLTPFQKMYCPERSIRGTFRPYWAIGFIERANERGGTPAGEKMWEIHDQLFHDMLSRRFGSFWGLLATGMEESGLPFDAMTRVDKEVVEDPDKIYYKYSSEEVSDSILDKIMTNIPYSSFEESVKMTYRGAIL